MPSFSDAVTFVSICCTWPSSDHRFIDSYSICDRAHAFCDFGNWIYSGLVQLELSIKEFIVYNSLVATFSFDSMNEKNLKRKIERNFFVWLGGVFMHVFWMVCMVCVWYNHVSTLSTLISYVCIDLIIIIVSTRSQPNWLIARKQRNFENAMLFTVFFILRFEKPIWCIRRFHDISTFLWKKMHNFVWEMGKPNWVIIFHTNV